MTLATKFFSGAGRLERNASQRVEQAMVALRRGFGGLVGLSAVFNLFMLSGSLFMLQVYDRVLTSRSLPEIGRRFGGRDHTTIMHGVRKIEELASEDQGLAEDIDLLKRLLEA